MWKSRELNPEDIGQQLPRLRKKLEKVFPAYVTSLERVSWMPVEFGRRWRASWVEEHLEKVRQSYQQLVNRGMVVGFFGGMVADIMGTVLRQPPTEGPATARDFAIAVSPWGEARPVLKSMSSQQSGVVAVRFEEFERAALKLRDDVLGGELEPEDEVEVRRLIYEKLVKGEPELKARFNYLDQ